MIVREQLSPSVIDTFGHGTTATFHRARDLSLCLSVCRLHRWGLAAISSSTQPELIDEGNCGPFPFNVCLPQVSLSGDRLLVLGGEADMREVAGVSYAHDGNFVVQGTLRVSTDV